MNRGKKTNQSGQGMIEYIMLVALISVAALGIISILGHTISSKLSQVTIALQGRKSRVDVKDVEEKHWRQRSMNDFFKSQGRDE